MLIIDWLPIKGSLPIINEIRRVPYALIITGN